MGRATSRSSGQESGREVRASVCPLDCPDRCSLDVLVREGRVVSIEGSRRHSLTAGFICSKVSRFARRLYGADRLRFPLRRKGPKGLGDFVRVSWSEAISEIAVRLRLIMDRYGGEAVLPFYYGGSNGLMTQGSVDAHFFRRLGASRLARTVCAASTTMAAEALYGKMPGIAFEDYPEAGFILLWGANPTHSNIHLVPHLKAARKRGAKIGVVDPRRILGDDLVDLSLQPFPGTDVVVALAMIRYLEREGLADQAFLESHAVGWQDLLEYAERYPMEKAAGIARVPPQDIARMAEAYAHSNPALVRCGWGLERNRNGLASVAAVLALPAVAGKFGRVGGGYTLSNGSAFAVDDTELGGVAEAKTRIMNMNQLGRILLEEKSPPIHALFVYNCNPAATLPHHNQVLRGLARQDLFTVVFDQVMTDTGHYADIVLPATTFLEHRELNRSYGAYALQLAEPVIEPEGEAKSNYEAFQLLGRAMGWEDGMFAEDPEQLLLRALRAVQGPLERGFAAKVRSSDLIAQFDFPGKRPVQFSMVFPATLGRRIRLYPDSLGSEPYCYREETTAPIYPLALISPSSSKSISSTLGECNLPEARLEMNPLDAGERGIADGDRVRIFNDLGEVHCSAKLEPRLRPGVVSLAKGMWRRATLNGSVGNALVPDHTTPISGGACFNDARVQVARF